MKFWILSNHTILTLNLLCTIIPALLFSVKREPLNWTLSALLMGGNALKNTPVQRVVNLLHERVQSEMRKKLECFVDEVEILIEKPGKIDHGDVDILYKPSEFQPLSMIEFVHSTFAPLEMVVSGPVLSFSYNTELLDPEAVSHAFVQVDLIEVENMNMSKFYFSYGDLGKILGCMTRHYGIRFGAAGLYLSVSPLVLASYNPTILKNEVVKVTLSQSPEEICAFLGLNFERWGSFTSEVEIFEWVMQSPLYNVSIFANNGNRAHRQQVQHRAMYQHFLEYSLSRVRETKEEEPVPRQCMQREALRYFQKEEVVVDMLTKASMKASRKAKFSGATLIKLGVSERGPQVALNLERFRLYVKESIAESFDDWIDSRSAEEVERCVLAFFVRTVVDEPYF
jgi:hypothetical protein